MLNHIFVTNTNEFPHQDRYDGEDYSFPPGEKVLIPLDAAQHMLGYGLADKTEVLLRLGWAWRLDPSVRNFVQDEEGVTKLKNFIFEEAEVRPKTRELA